MMSLPVFAVEAPTEITVVGNIVLPVIAIVVLVVLNGLFVAAEFALVGARVGRLDALAERGSGAAQWLADLMRRHAGKDSYIAVAQLGITLASIGLGMYGEPAVATLLFGPLESIGVSGAIVSTLSFVIALSVITYLHVVLGEMIPKALALQAPESVSVRLNPLMRFFSTLFKPMVAVLNAIAFALLRLLRIPEPDKSASLFTSDELAIVTEESAESGHLGQLQRDMIRNIFELDERPAEEIMISRANIVAVDKGASSAEIAKVISSSTRSRYPVIDGDLDHVVGMLHIKDFIRSSQLGTFTSLDEILRPLSVVAARTTAEDLLEDFKRGLGHAALVVDEHGSTVGFISLDDVINEIMEDDVPDWLIEEENGEFLINGEAPLFEMREQFGDAFAVEDDVVTVAGLILNHTGEVPEVGTEVIQGDHTLTVAAVEGRRITRVRVVTTGGE